MNFDYVTLGELVNYIRGITFKNSDRVDPNSPSAVVCMRTKNIQKMLDEADIIAVPRRFVKRKEQYLKTGDILISNANSRELVGKCVSVPPLDYSTTAGAFISIVRPIDGHIDPIYLYRWLSSGPIQHQIRHQACQTTNIANLSVERFLRLKIPLPLLTEQRRIAAILDKADAVRRKRQEAIRLTEELLRSAFLEMFGDPVTNPKGWLECKLEEVSELGVGATKGRNLKGKSTVSVPYMRVANVQDGYLNLDDIKEIEIPTADLEKHRLQAGDVLLTEGGDPDKLGRGSVWRGQIDPCIHQNHIFRVRPDRKHILPEYLSALIGSVRGKTYFLRAAKQTTGIATINKTQLRNFPVLLPPINLQLKFAHVVETFGVFEAKVGEQITVHNNLFNALVQRAFRGEL